MNNESGSNSRRKFLVQAASFTALVGAGAWPLVAEAKPKGRKLTILHSNDTHSQIDPFALNDPRYPGMGGIAKRAEIIKRIRAEEENVLLLDSGDIYQGTPYFNLYGGSIEFKLMSMLGYDASTMGNHDFDIGLNGFLKNLPHAQFPFLCSNYDFTNTILEGKTQRFKIFEKQGLRIGVFGLGVKLKGLVLENLYGETEYHNPIETATDMAQLLKQEKRCHYVICLSHLGFDYEGDRDCDTKLAQRTKNIDLILGGHSHTVLEEPRPYKNQDGKEVLVAQTGFGGIRLGRIDVYFDLIKGGKQTQNSKQIEVS
jgi:5'-nucleotidase